MISKPTAFCPRCGARFTMIDTVDIFTTKGVITWYGECFCGAANITVTQGQVSQIKPRDPIEFDAELAAPDGAFWIQEQ